MRTIAVVNLKGGVAKTATVINVAAVLAKDYRQEVLVIDADSQCNTTEFFGGDPSKGNLADLLRHRDSYLYPEERAFECIQDSNFYRIDLLCADDSLMDLDLSKVEGKEVDVTVLKSLRLYLTELEGQHGSVYDWCLIDCPPAFNASCAAALLMADEVLIPIKLDAFSLRGMTNLLRQIENMRKINPHLKLLGCLPTMWYSSSRTEEAIKILTESHLPLFGGVRRTDKMDEMTWAQVPLLVTSPHSAAGIDYRKFVRELMKGGNKND